MAAKTVLITGCSKGGIGDALAREFRARGHVVFATDLDTTRMAGLEEAGISTLQMDVTSTASIAAALETVGGATGGRLDVLINNAGRLCYMPFADVELDEVRRMLDVNVWGVMAVTHACLPLLVAAGGLVASIGSVNQVLAPPYLAAYNASKAAVAAFGHTLRVELAPLGVRVVTVVTGSVSSNLFANAGATTLPADSLYRPLRDSIEQRSALGTTSWTSPEAYASQVVSDLLKPRPKPVLWRAALSSVARLVGIFGWVGMLAWSSLPKSL